MMMKYWADATGVFICAADEGWTPPAGAVEVPTAPEDARDVWRDGKWNASARIREALREAISARKNAFRDGGFVLDGVRWDSDPAARLAYAELAQRLAADPAFTTRWKASEGQWVDMGAALFAQVYSAGATHIAAAFAWQESEEARLAATADGELAGFSVSTPGE